MIVMDSINASLEYVDSENEIFVGSVTKQEVISKLKYKNLLTKELLDPLNNYMDDDHLDEHLIYFYHDIITGRGNRSDYTEFDLSDIQDSLEIITTENLNSESAVPEKDKKSDPKICLEPSVQENCEQIILSESCNHEEHDESEIKFNVTLNESVVEEIQESCLSITSDFSNVSYGQTHSSMDSSAVLNDTLEEMELLMKYGVNYMNKDESISSVSEMNVASDKIVENIVINITDSIRSNETKSPIKESSALVSHCTLESSTKSFISNSDNMTAHSCQSSNAGSGSKTSHFDSNNSLSSLTKSTKSDTSSVESDRYMEIANRLHISQTKTPNSQLYFNTPDSKHNTCPSTTPTLSVKGTLTDQNEEHIIYKNMTNHTAAKLKTPDMCPKLKTPLFKHGNTFKVPSITKVSSAKKSPNLRSIVSPIAMYIKNSPTVPLVKNVVSKHVHCALSGMNGKQTGDKPQGYVTAKQILPVRSYKPAARNIFISKENEPVLPGNIRKLIKGPLNPELIKHMGRVKDSPDRYPQAVPAIIQNNIDLTMLSTSRASEGMFNVSTGPPGDISVLVSKNAARTNCLQKP